MSASVQSQSLLASLVAFEHTYCSGPLQCIINTITQIWAGIIYLLQAIFSFLTCRRGEERAGSLATPIREPIVRENARLATPIHEPIVRENARSDPFAYRHMEHFASIAGRRDSIESDFSALASHLQWSPRIQEAYSEMSQHHSEICNLLMWTSHYICHQGHNSGNPEKIFALLTRLIEDLAGNHLLADFSDLVQSNDTGLIDQALHTFLETEKTAPIIEAMHSVAQSRYADVLAKHPLALPEVDKNFSRWDLLAVTRFHCWYHSLADNPASFDANLQKILDRLSVTAYVGEEIKCFALLVRYLQKNDALAPFLNALRSDPSATRCLQFYKPWSGLAFDPRALFQQLGLPLPLAFPKQSLAFTEESALTAHRFRVWLSENFPSADAVFDEEEYLTKLDYEMRTMRATSTIPQEDPLRLEKQEIEIRLIDEHRKFAILIRHLRKSRGPLNSNGLRDFGLKVFFDSITRSVWAVEELPHAIYSENPDQLCYRMLLVRY